MADPHRDPLLANLAAYGADLSRWPDGAREARARLLSDREFRRAFDEARTLDRVLSLHGAALDRGIEAAGSLDRVRRAVLRRRPANFLDGVRWQRIAAAVLVAGMLGGAVDLVLPDRQVDALDAALDPLYVAEADIR